MNLSNPGSFVDLSRKVDQILTLLQGSTSLNQPTQDSVLQSLQTIKDRISLARTLPSLNNDSSINELRQMLTSNNSQIIQRLDQVCQQLNSNSTTQQSIPVQSQLLNLDVDPPLLNFGSEGNIWPLNDTPQMDARSTLIYNQNVANMGGDSGFMNETISTTSINENQQILNVLTEIRSRLGGNVSDDSITALLNLLQRNMNNMPVQSGLNNGDINGLKTTLREVLVPSMSDTLIQTSNMLITTIRDEIQNILGKYSDVNVSLNNLRTTLSQRMDASDPTTLARRDEIQENFRQLSDKFTEYSAMVQQLRDTTAELVGQSNDNTRMIFAIGNKIQNMDKLQEAINNSNNLLSKNIDNRKTDIDQLIYENVSLREHLQKLLEALNMVGTPLPNKKRYP